MCNFMSETIKIYKSVYLLKEAYDNGPNLSYDGSYFPLTPYRERNDRKYGFEINILCFRYMVDVKKCIISKDFIYLIFCAKLFNSKSTSYKMNSVLKVYLKILNCIVFRTSFGFHISWISPISDSYLFR